MNIKQNIVCIKTATQMGTGIILSCENKKNEFGRSNYIILTNYHVVKDLPRDRNDLLLSVDFEIYDSSGRLVEIPKNSEEKKVELHLFCKEFDGEIEDIAAFFISFDYKINLDLENKIVWNDSDLGEIYIEGFPQILMGNQVSTKMQVRGMFKSIFPLNNKVGVFQIVDDYHWYSNYKDMRLFQGFSGSPIYKNENGLNYIVGMNQSSFNLDDGENPFKLLYYFKITYLLEYLREQGCIFYKRNEDDSVSIRWNDSLEDKCTEDRRINILLLGASGAGKSSFAKTFLLHSRYIDSTNDGQTTRTNIVYSLTKTNTRPQVDIRFLNQDNFIKKMIQLNYANYLLKIINIKYRSENFHSLEDFLRYVYLDKKEIKADDKLKENITKILMPQLTNAYQDNHDYFGKICDICEKVIEDNIERREVFFEENRTDLLASLSNVEGFFDEKEFSFLWDNSDEEDIIQMDVSEGINNFFETYYKQIHQKIFNKLKEKKIVIGNNYYTTIKLNKYDSEKKDLLTLCLQVKEKKSLTGVVDFVQINDAVSNEYSFIMDDLDISSLKLIDTYGLDHDNWDESKSIVLSNIIYDLVDKKLVYFDSNLAVAYVKKLDSGKPTELKTILPLIYSIIPQAPVYCVLNGLDIFLDSRIDQFKTCDIFFSSVQMPKAVKYINSEKCKRDITGSINGGGEFGDNLYNTLKNNIIPFCSNSEKIEAYYSLYKNNISQIYNLLISICMKEYSSMNIIPKEIIEDIQKGKYDQEISLVIKEIFQKSSKTNWEWDHWKTTKANFWRINEQNELGYWGTYQYRWNQLFHRGYVETVKNNNILTEIGKEKGCSIAISACIKNMENDFLGPAYNLVDFKVNEKSEFRKNIEKMYKLGKEKKIYPYNPFEDKKEDIPPQEYLDNVCDFQRGFQLIEEDLLAHFKRCLINTIKNENKAKSKNLLKINNSFYIQYQNLKYEFEKKYSGIIFEDIMKYAVDNGK